MTLKSYLRMLLAAVTLLFVTSGCNDDDDKVGPPAAGLLPESDLSGDMVLLQIEPSGNTSNALEASAKETNVVACRVADPSVCTVIAGGREYARAVLPLFEFGRTINVALPRRK